MSEPDVLLDSIAGEDGWRRHQLLEELRSTGAGDARIAALVEALGAGDPTRRAAARMALSVLASPRSPAGDSTLDALVNALRHGDRDSRILAASALGESEHPAAGPPLVAALDDAEPNVVAAAADALGELAFLPALRPLEALATGSEFWLRAAAIVALGRLGDERALPALARAAEDPGLERPLIRAIESIGHLDGLRPLEILRHTAPEDALLAGGRILCAHPEAGAPDWLVEEARTREHRLRDLLAKEDSPAAARLLGLAAGEEAVQTLLDLIRPPRESEAAIAGLLAAPGHVRAPAILARLDSADADEKVTLLSILPPVRERSEIERLIPLLEHEHAEVRAEAAEALARAPAEETVSFLVNALDRDGVAPELVRAMGGLGEAMCGALEPLLSDPSRAVRMAAARALTRCGNPSVASAVQAAYASEPDVEVRQELLRTVGRTGGATAVAVLAAALRTGDPHERLAALEGLGLTHSPEAVPPLQQAMERSAVEAIAAIRALGHIPDPASARALLPHFSSTDIDRRREAAKAAVPMAAAVPTEAALRLTHDTDEWVRIAGARVLARQTPGHIRLRELAEADPAPAVREEVRRMLGEQ